jgi:amino acid adenylation domain-containing protein
LQRQGYHVIPIEDGHIALEESNLHHPISPDNLAYVLYTSGTTGAPKGVLQTHRNVLHHIRVYTNKLQIGPKDRLTQLASFSFDAAVMDIFGALLNGATLYPINFQETGLEPLSSWLAEQAITIYHSTPTVYRYWMEHLQLGSIFPALRLVVLGGEVATQADFEAYRKNLGPDCFFVNGLGPTESTVSLQFIASHATKLFGQTVPVGYPVEDTEIILVDAEGQTTDVYGEIVLRSRYVALGYWHQPELTQSAFSGPPYPDGLRQYRTGDLGRYRPDGMLEFRGRTDTQVKIRGYRIELGEIETALLRHPSVHQVVCLCREDGPSEKHVVAYLVPTTGHSSDVTLLRAHLSKLLPEYMVPSRFVFLATLPLTPNGKVNKQALPAPKMADYTQGLIYVAPTTVVEELIVELWQEVLKIERIGIHDNFFELGGHSLVATQVIARLRQTLELDIPLRNVFEYPTIALFASAIDRQLAKTFNDWPTDQSVDLPANNS